MSESVTPLTHEHDGPLVVFLIGMRINRWWRPDLWLPVFAVMPTMLAELSRDPGSGLLGYRPDDERIRTAFDHAAEAGLHYTFQSVGNASTLHPNTIKLNLTGPDGHRVEVVGQSRGGGVIRIVEVDGFGCDFSGALHTLVVDAHDVPGSIAFIASTSQFLSAIARNTRLSRSAFRIGYFARMRMASSLTT